MNSGSITVLSASTNMKVVLLTLSLIGCALSEAPPYPAAGNKPQGALLLLPPQYRQPSESGSTFQGAEVEDLSKVSDKEMERLRQEVGSDSGSYHVYLADGRLQKVQYTTAPVKSRQQGSLQDFGAQTYSGNQEYSSQYNQRTEVDGRNFLSQDSSNFGRFQQDFRQQNSQLNRQYSNDQYNQQQQNDQYNQIGRYRQQQNGLYSQNGQYNDQPKQLNGQERSEVNPIIAQFGRLQQDFQQQQIQQLQQRQQQLEQEQERLREQQEQLKSANYVASLQYSNVEPITSPIYSYKPSPVTRVLRYAPKYF